METMPKIYNLSDNTEKEIKKVRIQQIQILADQLGLTINSCKVLEICNVNWQIDLITTRLVQRTFNSRQLVLIHVARVAIQPLSALGGFRYLNWAQMCRMMAMLCGSAKDISDSYMLILTFHQICNMKKHQKFAHNCKT